MPAGSQVHSKEGTAVAGRTHDDQVRDDHALDLHPFHLFSSWAFFPPAAASLLACYVAGKIFDLLRVHTGR